jgi:PAS domain S-box-containing protein
MAKAQILVVEDEIVVAESMRNRLESLDYGVPAIVASGEKAIEKAGEMRPNLVLMDIKLAGEMDGIEAAEEIRARFDIPVIYVTAFADDETLQRAKITEPYGYILKPLQARDLRTNIEMALYKHRMESELRASEERYRQALENSPNPIFSIDREGTIQTWNQACERLFQYTPEEVIGQAYYELLWNPEQGPSAETMLEAWQGSSLSNQDMTYRCRDGTQRFTVSRIYPLRDSKGDVQGWVFANTDITERRRAEEEIQRRTAQLEALREVGLELTAELDLDALLHSIVSWAVELLSGAAGAVDVYRADRNLLERAVDTPGGTDRPLGNMVYRLGEGLSGKVWESGEPLVVSDYEYEEKPPIDWKGHPGIVSVVGVPIHWHDEFLGVVSVASDVPDAFSTGDVELLNLLATQAAIAIRNARLFDEAHRRAERLMVMNRVSRAAGEILNPDDLIEAVYREVIAVFQADALCIAFHDKETNELNYLLRTDGVREPPQRRPLGTGLISTVIATNRPLLIRDIEQERHRLPPLQAWETTELPTSWLGVPIQTEEQVTGVICAHAYRPYAFDEEDQLLLSTIADQVAVAVENARLFQAEREQRELAEALEETATAVSTLDLDKVLDRVLEQVGRVVAGDAFNIVLVEQETVRVARWRTREDLGIEQQGPRLVLPIARYPNLVKMMETGKPLVIPDTAADPGWVRQKGWEWVHSYVGAPIQLADSTIGFLAVDGTRPGQFNLADARRLGAFTSHVATAIENARLYEQAQRRLASLMNLNLASQLMASSLEVKEILEQIVNLAGSVVDSDYTSVVLADENGQLTRQADDFRGILPISQRIRANGITRYVLDSGQPLVIDTISDTGMMEPPLRQPDGELITANPALVGARIHSFAVAPIQVKGETMGVMFVHSREPHTFHGQLPLLTTFANQAAVAIENAHLFQAEQEQRELAEALAEAAAAVNTLNLDQVLDRILEQVERIVAGDAFNIMLLEDNTVQAVRWRGYERLGLEEYIANLALPLVRYPNMMKMAQTGEPIVIPDTAIDPHWTPEKDQKWWRSYIGAPIQVEGVTVGFLNVNGTRRDQFDSADAQRLQAFANHTAAAVANARLHQELGKHAQQLEQQVEEQTAEVQAQYAQLEAIFSSTADGIVVADKQGVIIRVNPVARAWLTQALPARDTNQLWEALQNLTLRADERPEAVLELEGLDLELKATPISEPGAEEAAAVVMIHDISELKALDRIKTNFVKNASHELRTPISTIKLYAHLIQQTPSENEKWRQYLDRLVQEVDDQAQLGEDILQLSRIYAGRVEAEMEQRLIHLTELTEVAVSRHQSLARERKVTLEHGPAQPGPVAAVATEQMMQVLTNLVEDAIRYTPEGGRVIVTTGQEERHGRVWATVAISDTGKGIPSEDMPHIFDRLFREGDEEPRSRRVRETGLRLMVVKEIAGLHGGEVTVESQEGVGSTFTIWLPPVD